MVLLRPVRAPSDVILESEHLAWRMKDEQIMNILCQREWMHDYLTGLPKSSSCSRLETSDGPNQPKLPVPKGHKLDRTKNELTESE